jgi:uncharacterized protein YajQ (UPF0234 family)
MSSNQDLSEEFVREFKDKWDWSGVSKKVKLSENFIMEFQEKVDWEVISENQILSLKFIKKYISKICLINLERNRRTKLTDEDIKSLKKLLVVKEMFVNKKGIGLITL